jgi:hypothetical protein
MATLKTVFIFVVILEVIVILVFLLLYQQLPYTLHKMLYVLQSLYSSSEVKVLVWRTLLNLFFADSPVLTQVTS